MKLTVLTNPVVGLQLSELRAAGTQRNRFCELIELITTFLIYEAASDLPTQEIRVLTPTPLEIQAAHHDAAVALSRELSG